jgi:hypothetical protein
LVAEIYQMDTDEEAFGIYAAELSPGERPVDIGVQGYVSSNVVNFWQGPYYVKLTSYSAAPGIESALVEFGTAIEARMEDGSSEPPLLDVFPEKDRVHSSERFVPRNFLGQPFLNRGYRVDYDSRGIRYQLVLVEFDSPNQASDGLARYTQFLETQGARITRAQESTYTVVTSKREATSIFFQRGSFMGGVVGIEDVALGGDLVHAMIEELSSVGG